MGSVHFLIAVAVIVIAPILLVLITVAVVSAVVATVHYTHKRQRRRLVLDTVYGSEQGMSFCEVYAVAMELHSCVLW